MGTGSQTLSCFNRCVIILCDLDMSQMINKLKSSYVQKRKVFDRRKSAESFCATDYIFNTFWSFEYNVILRALHPYQKFISKPHLQRAGVRFFQSDNEEDEDEEEDGEDTEAVITVPPAVKVDKECWTHEPEFDKYVLYSTKISVLSSFF